MSSDSTALPSRGWGSEDNTFAPLKSARMVIGKNLESVHGLYPPIEDGLKLMMIHVKAKR